MFPLIKDFSLKETAIMVYIKYTYDLSGLQNIYNRKHFPQKFDAVIR